MPAAAASPTNARATPVGVVALTVIVFAAVVAVVTLRLRDETHRQLLRGEADKLAAVASMQIENSAEDAGGVPLSQVPDGVLIAMLRTSKYRGVAGVRVFDQQKRYQGAWPIQPSNETPAPDDWAQLRAGDSVARLHRDAGEEIFSTLALPAAEPVIEAWVPLRQTKPPADLGAAQFWVRGGELVADMAAHDQRLWLQAGFAWFVGSLVIVTALVWAFRRLAAANVALRARGEDLLRANRELVLAAKTSALGAVTAHLMHELKNPLAGLELIMAGQAETNGDEGAPAGGELAAASELTRRLRTMVNDVVGVLRDEQTAAEFELTAGDVVELAVGKVQSEARARGIELQSSVSSDAALAGRRGNLATLVLRNLLQNALEATPTGGAVRVMAGAATAGGVEFVVEDGGRGLPEPVRARLFQPCASTKVGGSGLGLALSYQLAQQAGGRLELVRSDERGTSFRLVLAPQA